MPKFKVTLPDGTVQDLDQSAIELPDGFSLNSPSGAAEGYITTARADAEKSTAITNAVNERFKSHVAKDAAAKDADVIAAVLAEHGKDAPDLNAEKSRWAQEFQAEKLDPLQNQLSGAHEQIKALAIRALGREAGLDESWLAGKRAEFLINDLASRLEIDPEHGDEYGLVGLNAEGKRISGGADKAFGGVAELLEGLRTDSAYSDYYAKAEPQGGGRGTTGYQPGAGNGRIYTKSEAEQIADGFQQGTVDAETFNNLQTALAEGRIQE